MTDGHPDQLDADNTSNSSHNGQDRDKKNAATGHRHGNSREPKANKISRQNPLLLRITLLQV